MKRLLLLLSIAAAALAQQPQGGFPQNRIIKLKHAPPAVVAEALTGVHGGHVRPSAALGAVIVSGSVDFQRDIESALALVDVPQNSGTQNVELRVYLVGVQAEADMDSIPAAIRPALAELQKASTYKGFRLLETINARGREMIRVAGGLPGKELPGRYSLATAVRILPEATTRRVRLENFSVQTVTPYKTGDQQFSNDMKDFSTTVDIPEGQTVVIGRASMLVTDPLILVVSARVVD